MSKTAELINTWREIGPIAWAESDHGWIVEDGAPIRLTHWQRAPLAAWWDRRATVSTLAISNVKKTGKTLINAVLLAWRWLALPGEHFAVGNDLDQSAGRQFAMIADMVQRNAYMRRNVEASKRELIFKPTGSRIAALAGDAAGNAGANHLTASHTEAWGVIYEGGVRAWEELTPPPGAFYGLPALRIADSYAGWEGESVTWHGLVDRGQSGERVSAEWPIFLAGGMLLFHLEGDEARARCYRGSADEAHEYYAEQRRTLRPNAFERMHGNRRTAGESQFVTAEAWEACYVAERPQSNRLILGADASTTRDTTALVGTAYNSTTGKVDALYCKVWTPKRGWLRGGKATVDLDSTIGAEVERLHDAGQVHAVYYDPYQLHALAVRWERAGICCIELPQTTGRVAADSALYDAIQSGALAHSGDGVLSEHVLNAVAYETPRGLRLAKEKTSKKIDAAVALSMSHYGALELQKAIGELHTIPNIFYEYSDQYRAGRTWATAGQSFVMIPPDNGAFKHPPGMTWQNCRKRNAGCEACIAELTEAGWYDRIENEARLFDPHGEPMTEESARLDFAQRLGGPHPVPPDPTAPSAVYLNLMNKLKGNRP